MFAGQRKLKEQGKMKGLAKSGLEACHQWAAIGWRAPSLARGLINDSPKRAHAATHALQEEPRKAKDPGHEPPTCGHTRGRSLRTCLTGTRAKRKQAIGTQPKGSQETSGTLVAFCSPAKSLTFSGLVENPLVRKKLKS